MNYLQYVPKSSEQYIYCFICIITVVHSSHYAQYAVFYSGEQCLGGGVIDLCGPSLHELGLTSSDFDAKIT